MNKNDLIERTKKFAVEVIKLVRYLEKNCGSVGRTLGVGQLLRSGTGIYSNYRAACRCKSAKDFIRDVERENIIPPRRDNIPSRGANTGSIPRELKLRNDSCSLAVLPRQLWCEEPLFPRWEPW